VLLAFCIVSAYCIGTFPTAVLIGRRTGTDPTRAGSKNPGASNVYRLSGRKAGVIVGVVDALKGLVPVLVVLLAVGRPEAHLVWMAAVAGHVWPITRRFRGGKGVATAGGGGLVLAPVIGILTGLVFVVVVRTTRVAALGSLTIAAIYPLLIWWAGHSGSEVLVSAIISVVVVVRHRSNIAQLLDNVTVRN
jgi:glycerol-3-phosphate acyltransferase PlsY